MSRIYTKRSSAGAPVYLATVIEYLAAEVLELTRKAARDKKTMIIPRHLHLTNFIIKFYYYYFIIAVSTIGIYRLLLLINFSYFFSN